MTYKNNVMKNALVVLCLLLISAPALAQEQTPVLDLNLKYFEAIEDIPVMPGLTEKTEQSVAFDKPEGRVVESVAVGGPTQSAESIEEFYSKVLPQLGWRALTGSDYIRESEHLKIGLEPHKDEVLVRFTITPQQSKKQ